MEPLKAKGLKKRNEEIPLADLSIEDKKNNINKMVSCINNEYIDSMYVFTEVLYKKSTSK